MIEKKEEENVPFLKLGGPQVARQVIKLTRKIGIIIIRKLTSIP
jgi:hypothetical protein